MYFTGILESYPRTDSFSFIISSPKFKVSVPETSSMQLGSILLPTESDNSSTNLTTSSFTPTS